MYKKPQQPIAPIEAGYSQFIATIMTNAAFVLSGQKATFDVANRK